MKRKMSEQKSVVTKVPKIKIGISSTSWRPNKIMDVKKLACNKDIRWAGGLAGEDPRGEFLLKFCGVLPQAANRRSYLGFASGLYVNDDTLRNIMQKDIRAKKADYLQESAPLDLSTKYEELLKLQQQSSSKTSPRLEPKKPDNSFEVKKDGTIIIGLKERTIVAPPIKIPVVRMTSEEVQRFLKPAKRPNFADPYYKKIAELSKLKIKELEKAAEKDVVADQNDNFSIAPPIKIPVVRMTSEEVQRFLEPAKRPNADPYYKKIGELSDSKLKIKELKKAAEKDAVADQNDNFSESSEDLDILVIHAENDDLSQWHWNDGK